MILWMLKPCTQAWAMYLVSSTCSGFISMFQSRFTRLGSVDNLKSITILRDLQTHTQDFL